MINNPFERSRRITNPEVFYVRPRLLQEVQSMISSGISVALFGQSGLGKSALLDYLVLTSPTWLPGQHVVYMDLQPVLNVADFCHEVCNLSNLPAGGELSNLYRNLRDAHLVLLLDEAERLNELDGNLHSVLRSLINANELTVMTASRKRLADILPDSGGTSPLENVFVYREILPLTLDESIGYLRHGLSGSGHSLPEEQLQAIAEESRGIPSCLQVLAAAALNAIHLNDNAQQL